MTDPIWTNSTPFPARSVVGQGPGDRATMTLVVKATYSMRAGRKLEPAPEQLPILATDQRHDNDPAKSVRLEHDLAPFKPRTDVVVVGSAHSPNRKAVTELVAGLRIGSMAWALKVTGDREWTFPSRLALIPGSSFPHPFIEMPLVYERTYGGIDEATKEVYLPNPIGRGFASKATPESLHKKPLPNIEGVREGNRKWDTRSPPVGFGFSSRSYAPRLAATGIDPDTGARVGPFRFDYWNGANPELQVQGYLRGDEDVELRNLSPRGPLSLRLAGTRPVVRIRPVGGREAKKEALREGRQISSRTKVPMNLDTLVFMPNEERLYVVWRGLYPIATADGSDVESVDVAFESVRPLGYSDSDDYETSVVFITTMKSLAETAQVVSAFDLEQTCRIGPPPNPGNQDQAGSSGVGATGSARSAGPVSESTDLPAIHLSVSELSPGSVLFGRYKLERLAGSGPHAMVWLARDEERKNDVALKLLSDTLAGDPELVSDLRRDVERSIRLDHSNICSVHEFIQQDGLTGISMEYVHGRTLAALLAARPSGCFSASDLKGWIRQLCDALESGHRASIIHGAVTPAQMMIDGRGAIRLTDFAVSRCLADHESRLAGAGSSAANLSMVSPQLAGGRMATAHDDVYAIGATIFCLLTGAPPFTEGNITTQVLGAERPTVTARRIERGLDLEPVSPEWEATIAACLSRSPGDRPPSATEVARLLGLRF